MVRVGQHYLSSEHLRAMLVYDLIITLCHPESITDREQFIADFTELVKDNVICRDDPNN
jgi:hypothetical protein